MLPAHPEVQQPLAPLKSLRYDGPAPGVRLIVTGAVHGNETCGTRGIERIVQELDSGQLQIKRGRLTLVPIANALAYALKRRAGDRNLNRAFGPTGLAREYEDVVTNWLSPLLEAHDGLLDLHSFTAQGDPFVMMGPRDNRGAIEPFAHAAIEEGLARRLGVARAVDGWLPTYVEGVARRRAASPAGTDSLDVNPRYGIGTTEYMRSRGGWGLTLECGQHDDPNAPEVAYRAIRTALAFAGLTDDAPPPPSTSIESLSLRTVVDKRDPDDRFVKAWKSFDPVEAGEPVGIRADGETATAPLSGRIMFPNPAAGARQEWFYVATPSGRL